MDINQLIISNFHNAKSGLCLFKPSGEIFLFNKSADRFFVNTKGKQLVNGMNLIECLPPKLLEKYKLIIKGELSNQRPFLETTDKENDQYFDLIFSRLEHEVFGIYFQLVIANVTESKKLQRTFDKVLYMGRFTKNLITVCDKEMKIIYVNPSFEKVTGYLLEEIKGKDISKMLIGPNTDTKVVQYKHRQIRDDKPYNIQILNYNKNNEKFWQDLEVVPLKDDNDEITGYMSIGSDITEKIKQEKKHLREILRSNEKERNTIAANLHDNLGQLLGAIHILQIKNNKSFAADARTNQQKEAGEKLVELIDQSISELRAITHDLNSKNPGNFSFTNKLEDLIYDIELLSDIKVKVDIDQSIDFVNLKNAKALKAVLRELFNNSIKHSKTQEITLKTLVKNEHYVISYSDEGCGFDWDGNFYQGSSGLRNVFDRIESFSGSIQLESSPGNGVKISIKVPLKAFI